MKRISEVVSKVFLKAFKNPFTGFLFLVVILSPFVILGLMGMADNQFNERVSSGNCVLSGTEELWKSGDVIIVKKYNCADGSILKRETAK